MTASLFSSVSALNASDRSDVFTAPIKFADLAGFERDDPSRQKALSLTLRNGAEARQFFETHFTPCPISGNSTEASEDGFLTGYYEPIVDGSLTRTRAFTAPLLGRPDDLLHDRAALDSGPITAAPCPSFGCETVWRCSLRGAQWASL